MAITPGAGRTMRSSPTKGDKGRATATLARSDNCITAATWRWLGASSSVRWARFQNAKTEGKSHLRTDEIGGKCSLCSSHLGGITVFMARVWVCTRNSALGQEAGPSGGGGTRLLGEKRFPTRGQAMSLLSPHLQRSSRLHPFQASQCGLSAYCVQGTIWEQRVGGHRTEHV